MWCLTLAADKCVLNTEHTVVAVQRNGDFNSEIHESGYPLQFNAPRIVNVPSFKTPAKWSSKSICQLRRGLRQATE